MHHHRPGRAAAQQHAEIARPEAGDDGGDQEDGEDEVELVAAALGGLYLFAKPCAVVDGGVAGKCHCGSCSGRETITSSPG
jgi:hypothetical protein